MMRAKYTIDSKVCLLGNGVDRWYISASKRSCLGNSEPQQWGSLLSEDEIAEVPMKTEQKKRKNTQNTRLGIV